MMWNDMPQWMQWYAINVMTSNDMRWHIMDHNTYMLVCKNCDYAYVDATHDYYNDSDKYA